MLKQIFIFLFLLNSSFSFGQGDDYSSDWKVQIGANQFWGGSVHFVEGRIKIGNAASYNLEFQRALPYSRFVGLSYSFISTDLTLDPEPFYDNNFQQATVDMNVHFINTVATQYFGTGVVSPFFDAGAGVAIYDVKSGIDNRVHFMLNFGTGVEFHLSDEIGLKLKGGAKLPLFDSGSGLYCGIGSYQGVDCGLSFSSSVLVAHWELGGTITYSF